ncbi:hypothetical protein ACQKIE_16225 [Luteibacter sp. NPDC031894]|uniref:hypothetical protein n=1 Tax=Luteibacter sp. NPDC031894 TaxID=3390572 RepID=UPI003CFC1781
MKTSPCYASHAVHHYLGMQAEAEAAQERLNAQTAVELRKRDTWVDGLQDLAAAERPTIPSPIIDALMAGDTAHFGHLVHKYITEDFAKQQAESAIEIQDEDWANGRYV